MEEASILECLKNANFTDEELSLLKNMEKGDTNNKKGHFYEKCFTVFQVLEFTTNQELADIFICNNESCFVDDLNIRYSKGNQIYKNNYQLKNSPNTGKWAPGLEQRFSLQKRYDDAIHQDKENISYLICSDKESIQFNLSKNITIAINQYYPYHQTLFEMLEDNDTKLKKLLQQVCTDETQHETALRLLFLPMDNEEGLNISLDGWWEQVLEACKPNIFIINGTWSFSDAFKVCCERNDFEIGSDFLSFRGWNCTLTKNLVDKINEIPLESWQKVKTPKELFNKLTELSIVTG